MSNRLEELKGLENFVSLTPATSEDITEAEKVLELSFSDDFKQYTLAYGAISVNGKEIAGVVPQKRLSVVNQTLDARKIDADFPSGFYVIENLGFESYLIIQSKDGGIYEYRPNLLKKIYPNLYDYIFS